MALGTPLTRSFSIIHLFFRLKSSTRAPPTLSPHPNRSRKHYILHTPAHIHTHTHFHKHSLTQLHTYLRTRTYTYTCTQLHALTSTPAHTLTHPRTHTHIYTHSHKCSPYGLTRDNICTHSTLDAHVPVAGAFTRYSFPRHQ